MRLMIVWVAAALMLTACTRGAENVQDTSVGLRNNIQGEIDGWSRLLTFTPRDTRPQLPQTRYCYQTQADIVCYDSPQPNMTAKMIGYQDGASISWHQPGGGSLGVSGGAPTAPHDAKTVQEAPSEGMAATPMEVSSNSAEVPAVAQSTQSQAQPFSVGESGYTPLPK